MSKLPLLILFIFLIFVRPVLASVSFSEVAWMGSVDSANYEWIELYNSGTEAVPVEGWSINDGLNLNINLSGVIGSNSYAVLERTSEESAPGAAFLIYTGALVNTGVTLILKNNNGDIVDQVPGGEDWQNIGGDNTTKETAQYTTSGWVTDVPTPGTKNNLGRVEEEVVVVPKSTTNSSKTSSGGSSKSSAATVPLNNTETKMVLTTEIQSVAYVNQNVAFKAKVKGLDENSGRRVRYEWNFGDSYYAASTSAKHSYRYPGTYIVTVYARKDKEEQTARHEITVLPVNFSITKNDRGDIQINNDAPYDVDISGYVLKGLESIIFPPRTVIVSKGTITIEARRLKGQTEALIVLYDNKRNLLASTYDSKYLIEKEFEEKVNLEYPPVVNANYYNKPAVDSKPVTNLENFNFLATEADANTETKEIETDFSTNSVQKETSSDDEPAQERRELKWPYLAFISLLLVAIAGILVSKR